MFKWYTSKYVWYCYLVHVLLIEGCTCVSSFSSELCGAEQSCKISLPNNKSSSSDSGAYRHIKYGDPIVIQVLFNFFNSVVKDQRLRRAFKSALTVTVHKSRGKNFFNPSNYRAIFLLPVISKVFKRTILSRIYSCNVQTQLN